jgi:hypothetical protein
VESNELAEIRAEALARIVRSERWFKAAFFGGAIFELAFLAALLLTADLSNRLDRLVLIGAVGSYSLVLLGLVAVAAYLNRSVLRVLQAIEAGGGVMGTPRTGRSFPEEPLAHGHPDRVVSHP